MNNVFQAYNMEETLAVSGQVMNLHNYLAVLEEIIKVGNLERNIIPKEFEKLSARFQVIQFFTSSILLS